jgi:hypothetical protein
MGFQVLTAASMKTAVVWNVAQCGLVEVYQRFRGACCLHHQGSDLCRDAECIGTLIGKLVGHWE